MQHGENAAFVQASCPSEVDVHNGRERRCRLLSRLVIGSVAAAARRAVRAPKLDDRQEDSHAAQVNRQPETGWASGGGGAQPRQLGCDVGVNKACGGSAIGGGSSTAGPATAIA